MGSINSFGRITLNTNDINQANKALNTFIVAAREYGLFFLTTRPSELIGMSPLIDIYESSSARTYLAYSPDRFIDIEDNYSEDLLNNIILKTNELILKDTTPFLIILAEALTYFWTNDYFQSFLTIWVGMEQYLFQKVSQIDRNFYNNTDKIFDVIEFLRRHNVYATWLIDNIHQIRIVRNNYVHQNIDLQKSDSQNAMQCLQDLLQYDQILQTDWINKEIPRITLNISPKVSLDKQNLN
jgi:hypothetical protein